MKKSKVWGLAVLGIAAMLTADWASGSGITVIAYNLIQQAGASLVKRSTLNFLGTGVNCVDNSGTKATDCTINQSNVSFVQTFTSQTSVTITHNLNTLGVETQCYDGSGFKYTPADIQTVDVNTVAVTNSIAQTGYCVVVSGTGNSATTLSADLYIATTGSDSIGNGTVGSPWRTMAFAMGKLPRALNKTYTIHVADGTYAESIDTTGVIAGAASRIVITGNLTSPANVVFTGSTAVCIGFDSPIADLNEGACIQSDGVALYGLTIAPTSARDGLSCSRCMLYAKQLIIRGGICNGINLRNGGMDIEGDLTISGFSSGACGSQPGGIGFYIANSAAVVQLDGALTIAGNAGVTDVNVGLNPEFKGSYSMLSPTASITVTGTYNPLLVTGGSSFAAYLGGTITLNNTTVPNNSAGIRVVSTSNFDSSGATVNVNNFATCLLVVGGSELSMGPGGYSLTNCTATSSQQNSVITLF